MSRRTLGRRIEEIEQSDVITPRNAIIISWLRKRPFRVGEVTIYLQAKLHAGTDGWTDKQGRQLESLTLCCGRVIVPGGLPLSGIKPELRPCALPVSLEHWKLDEVEAVDEDDPSKKVGLKWDSNKHAVQFEESLKNVEFAPRQRLSPKNLLVVRSDSTNGQPAFIEKLTRTGGIASLDADKKKGAPAMTGIFYGECTEHVADLTAEDLDKVPLFQKVNKGVNDLSVFVRRSDKAQQVVLKAQEPVAAGKRAKKPVSFSQTRFHLRILQDKRMDELFEFMYKIYTSALFGNDEKAEEFNELYKQVALHRDELAAIVKLFEPQLEYAALLGSTSVYTTSIAQAYYVTLSDAAEAFLKTVPGMKIKPVVETYLCSLLRRHASVSTINKAIEAKKLPNGSEFFDEDFTLSWRQSKRYSRLVFRDDMGNAAAFLDPAVRNGKWLIYGHSTADAIAFIARLVLGCIVLDDDENEGGMEDSDDEEGAAGGGLSAQAKAGLRKEYNKAVKLIEDTPKEDYRIDDAEFARAKAEKLVVLRQEYSKKGLVIKVTDEGAGAGAGAGAGVSSGAFLERAIANALADEVKIYDTRRAGVDFGDPLSKEDNKKRYQFWPESASDMPLLNFAAEILLGGMLTAMENERFHSAASFVMNKLRSSLTVVSVNRLTLCKRYLTKALDEANKLRDARNALDLLDVVDEALGGNAH
jgi:hypothetical protein